MKGEAALREIMREDFKHQTPCNDGLYAVTSRVAPTASVTVTMRRTDFDRLHEEAKHRGVTRSALAREMILCGLPPNS